MVRTGRPACGRMLSRSDWSPLRSGRDSPDGPASVIRAKRQSRRFYSSAGGFAVCYGYSVVRFHRKGAENEPAWAYTFLVELGPMIFPSSPTAPMMLAALLGKKASRRFSP